MRVVELRLDEGRLTGVEVQSVEVTHRTVLFQFLRENGHILGVGSQLVEVHRFDQLVFILHRLC